MSTIIPIILAGGQGTRLWPASLPSFPKQFLHIGEDSLIQQAVERVQSLGDELIILTSQQYLEVFPTHLRCSSDQKKKITLIGEPQARNTAAAIALAVSYILEKHDDAIIVLVAADHLIHSEEQFLSDVQRAVQLAEQNYISTFGIVPSRPETGYGYIECGEKLQHDAYAVTSFREKPDRSTAEDYIKQGGFLWNSGMFCFSAKLMKEELSLYAEEIHRILLKTTLCWETETLQGYRCHVPSNVDFLTVPKISIDYAVMEHTKRAAVVSARFSWNDIGSWDQVSEYMSEKAEQDVYLHDASNVSVRSDRTVAISGVSNIVVISENERILVMKKGTGQNISIFAKEDKDA